jgi:glycerol-3-phosphate acyltransferase PlsY
MRLAWVAVQLGVVLLLARAFNLESPAFYAIVLPLTAGGFLVLVPLALVIVIPIMGAVVAVTRYVSLGSIVGAMSAPLVVAVLYGLGRASGADIAYSAMVGGLVVLAHADSIARLRAGTERRIGDPR